MLDLVQQNFAISLVIGTLSGSFRPTAGNLIAGTVVGTAGYLSRMYITKESSEMELATTIASIATTVLALKIGHDIFLSPITPLFSTNTRALVTLGVVNTLGQFFLIYCLPSLSKFRSLQMNQSLSDEDRKLIQNPRLLNSKKEEELLTLYQKDSSLARAICQQTSLFTLNNGRFLIKLPFGSEDFRACFIRYLEEDLRNSNDPVHNKEFYNAMIWEFMKMKESHPLSEDMKRAIENFYRLFPDACESINPNLLYLLYTLENIDHDVLPLPKRVIGMGNITLFNDQFPEHLALRFYQNFHRFTSDRSSNENSSNYSMELFCVIREFFKRNYNPTQRMVDAFVKESRSSALFESLFGLCDQYCHMVKNPAELSRAQLNWIVAICKHKDFQWDSLSLCLKLFLRTQYPQVFTSKKVSGQLMSRLVGEQYDANTIRSELTHVSPQTLEDFSHYFTSHLDDWSKLSDEVQNVFNDKFQTKVMVVIY
jgi:hypothetical protein